MDKNDKNYDKELISLFVLKVTFEWESFKFNEFKWLIFVKKTDNLPDYCWHILAIMIWTLIIWHTFKQSIQLSLRLNCFNKELDFRGRDF